MAVVCEARESKRNAELVRTWEWVVQRSIVLFLLLQQYDTLAPRDRF